MASIQGVKVTGVIVPSDTLDTYAVIDPIYGIDGLRNLSGGTSALSGITSDRRRAGMLVGVNNGANYYKLNPAPWNNTISDWTPFSLGSTFTGGTVSGATTFTGGLSANTISATTYSNLPNASSTLTGVTKLSVNPAVSTNPIAVGVNDSRFLKSITGVTSVGNTITFRDVSGGTATINDVRVTGGTYDSGTGTATFGNSINSTFPVSGFFKPSDDKFVNSGTIDHDDNEIVLGYNLGGAGVIITDIVTVIEKDIKDIEALISNKNLVKGVTYKINNCDSSLYLNGIDEDDNEIYTTIYLKAIETDVLADTGVGVFYTPKYNNTFKGVIWSNLNTFVLENIVGEFIPNEQISNGGFGGATGTLFGDVTSGLFYINSGDWSEATTITGLESGASADIATLGIVSYTTDDILFWGGSVWLVNSYFQIGDDYNIFNLNTEFPIKQEFPLTENKGNIIFKGDYYNISYDEIKYDIVNDRITYRKDKNNNIVSTTADNINYWIEEGKNNPIKAFKWGHDFSGNTVVGIVGIGNQKIVNSYNENINFRGLSQYNIEMENLSSQYNIYGEGLSRQADLYLSRGTQRDIKLVDSYQSDLTLINSYQRHINIISGSYQRNVRLENDSEQLELTITNASNQRSVVFKNNSIQTDVIIRNDSIQSNIIFENSAAQSSAFIQNQQRVKFYNFSFDRGNDTINETDRIYTNTLTTNNSAPQVIGILDNELVEVDVSTFISPPGPIQVANTGSLFSIVLNAGVGSNADGSNFFGAQAGEDAINAGDSNFMGEQAGFQASGASNSNFFGNQAGKGATGASDSNFLGAAAGVGSTSAAYSNFIGNSAGFQASGAADSNFFGTSAGYIAKNANNSNFLGASAGGNANNASYSNFIGSQAGLLASGASNSNFLGFQAGYAATGATQSNFFGQGAGGFARNANDSNFLGFQAGYSGTSAQYSNFLGRQAGFQATGASSSNFMGFQAGLQANDANNSNFLGTQAGNLARNASESNFFGSFAGYSATTAIRSNFLGSQAGFQATSAANSNFMGYRAGYLATSASNSNFMGDQAGQNAINSSNSNFFGAGAGNGATNASSSNFLGQGAGGGASSVSFSNFIGSQAGNGATSAIFSNFIGSQAGQGATSASYSNLFGYQVGKTFTGNNIGANNIIIGKNISLPNTATNRINIGGVLFGSGTYSAATINPSITGQTQGRIGINVVNPSQALHVSGNTLVDGNLTATTISATTYNNLPKDVFTTGGTYSAGTAVFSNNTGGTFSVSGFSSGTSTNPGLEMWRVDYGSYNGNVFFDTLDRSYGSTQLSNNGSVWTNNTLETLSFNVAASVIWVGNGTPNIENIHTLNIFHSTLGYIQGDSVAENVANNLSQQYNTSVSCDIILEPNEQFYLVVDSLGSQDFVEGRLNITSLFTGEQGPQGQMGLQGPEGTGLFTGGTISSPTNFTGGLSANTFSATTYQNLPIEIVNGSSLFSFKLSAGVGAINAIHSNFFGSGAGNLSSDATYSNFMGYQAGSNASGANNSNFMGYQAGQNAISASQSNFMGTQAGYFATGASNSNFFGNTAGYGATNANASNFFGISAGNSAINANNSNFFGQGAGILATGASQSNFIGQGAGNGATNANNSNFLGFTAGGNAATGASFSNLFGFKAGYASNANLSIGSNNIIIGTNITLSARTTNSINLGGVLFGTGTYSTTGGTPSIIPSSAGRIGVAVVNPTKRLHISGETANDSGLRLETLTSASPTSAGQAIGVDSNGNVVTVAGGGVTPIYTAVTTSSVLTNANQTVIVDSSTDITITLPQIIVDGTKITIKNINTGIETILPYSGQLIDGDTSVIVARKNVSLDFQSYNNNWYLI